MPNGIGVAFANSNVGGMLGGDGKGGFNGTVSQINLNDWAGSQYFRVVPEPTSVLLLTGLAGVACLPRRSPS